MTALNGSALTHLSPTNGELVGIDSTVLQNNILGLGRNATTAHTRSPNGSLLSQRGLTATQYVLRDRLGSTIGLVQGTSIVRSYSYDPDGNASGTGTGATTDIRFAGGHTFNGVYHFGARCYDPDNACWTQPAPAISLSICGGICLSGDTDKGFGFGLGIGVSISRSGGGN